MSKVESLSPTLLLFFFYFNVSFGKEMLILAKTLFHTVSSAVRMPSESGG